MKKLFALSALAFAIAANAGAVNAQENSAQTEPTRKIEYKVSDSTAQTGTVNKEASSEIALSPEEIQTVKKALVALDYYHGEINGNNDEAFKKAIKDFQKDNELSQTGNPDEDTLDILATKLNDLEKSEEEK